ncbi:L,D-transpeptidase [Streptomyces beigongshangae]|uniref:L,D-transpeptidase n=1 Tax=Streptomyces beigongshangae TaxID=2841597 RepID=UPI001C851B27|nr:L,D-transpeptidase [Streptomyces sp. REN17]
MSDELTPGRRYADEEPGAGPDRAQLDTALRELAQDHETPATVPGAEIRRRAVRRRRRRTAALTAAGTACAGVLALVLAVVLTGGGEPRPVPPAASYGAPSPSVPPATAAPSPVVAAARVDLVRRELVAQGRNLPISSGTGGSSTPTGLMTVTAKYESAVVPGEVSDWRKYQVETDWVIRLRGADDRTGYLLALTWDEKAPGNYDSTGGAIGLRSADAKWLYGVLQPGAVVEVVGAAPTRSATEGAPSRTGLPEPSAATEPVAGPGAEPGGTDTAAGTTDTPTTAGVSDTPAAIGDTRREPARG